MRRFEPLSRRTFLRGMGTAMALPSLEAMLPTQAAAKEAVKATKRMAFIYAPNGVIVDKWRPSKTGRDYALSQTLEPLKGVKDHFQVISGLGHDKANHNGDGGGDHARANATFLTGAQARKTSGADIRIGISVDQMAAQKVGSNTKIPSLELSCDRARLSGNCDSGYSCAYQFNLSWASASTPMAGEANPRLVFERMFEDRFAGLDDTKRAQHIRYHRSILDLAMDDAKSMSRKLGRNDQRKLDEFMTAVRELEKRIQHAETLRDTLPAGKKPSGIPGSYKDHIRLMFDLMLLSFQTDTTRISTFLLAHDGSNRSFREIGVSGGHHGLSHHKDEASKIKDLEKIDRFYIEQFAYFLERLKTTPDGPAGSLLDQSMIVYGSGLSDANRHRHNRLPVLLAGRGGGSLNPGHHIDVDDTGDTPMTNLYMSMLDKFGTPMPRIGDSTGLLKHV